MVLSVVFLRFFSCCVLILFGFIMVYLIVLFFLSDSFYSVLVSVFCVSCIRYDTFCDVYCFLWG